MVLVSLLIYACTNPYHLQILHFIFMSQELYSIPTAPHAQYDYQRNLIERCIAGAAAWNIPVDVLTAIAEPRSNYEHAFSVSINSTTSNQSTTAARLAFWNVYVPMLISLLNTHIVNNPLISPADKEALNIHSNGGFTTISSPAQVTAPVVSFLTEETSALHVMYADPATPTIHAKPANVAFCELRYKIGDPAPISVSDCTIEHNVARSHESIVFSDEQRGLRIRGYARWVNKNGKKGPWSGQITAIIP
jgi:hypothetical protein